jgi:hypothetical protein
MASFVSPAVFGRSRLPAAFGLPSNFPTASSSRQLLHQLRGGGERYGADTENDEEEDDDEQQSSDDDDSDTDSDATSESNEADNDSVTKGSIHSTTRNDAVNDDDDASQGSEQQGHPMSTVMSMEPVAVVVKTNTGNPVLDQTVEFTVHPSRDVASIKQTLRRLLPGKPPVSMLKLVQSNVVLKDEFMVNELLDDDEDEDDEPEDDADDDEGGRKKKKLVLQLDMVPPVDPKFVVQLAVQMPEMTVSDLLDAYAMNEAAAYVHATAITMSGNQQQDDEGDDDRDENEEGDGSLTRSTPVASGSVTRRIKEQAAIIRRDLEESLLQSEAMQKVIQEGKAPAFHLPNLQERQVRGQRVRQAAQGGVKTTLKRKIQRNLNVNWVDTLRHFCLFLFFGYFGGRTPFSRAVLLLGAPSVFLLQARFVKLWIRQALYALVDHPPSILLSLLPAPQQSILSLDVRAAMETIYGNYATELRRTGSTSANSQENDDEENDESEEEDEDTFEEENDGDESEEASDEDE